MISEDKARNRILQTIRPLPPRRVSLASALNCFAAEDYLARLPLPGFDNSAMDGYAVVASSCGPGKRLRVIGEQPAGVDRQLRVSSGEAVRIFTGAPLPAGADAVVMQEDVTREGVEITLNTNVQPGDYVRRRACDLSEGQKILTKGERIRPTILALLASQGFAEVMVGGEASAGIISTGDELAKPGEELQAGQIYESNSVLLEALLQHCGVIERSIEQCPDDPGALIAAFKRGVQHHVLLINGGVSVGEHDFVKSAMQSLGGEIDIWRVAIKPGKPFLYGRIGNCIVFGLPGNPVSAFVTFLQFVRPAILKMMGGSDDELQRQTVPARLTVDLQNAGDRAHYIRGKLGNGCFTPVGRQESHALFGLSQSNALLRLAPGTEIKRDTAVEVEIWD
jgi:molybdopterin molybdotransferase